MNRELIENEYGSRREFIGNFQGIDRGHLISPIIDPKVSPWVVVISEILAHKQIQPPTPFLHSFFTQLLSNFYIHFTHGRARGTFFLPTFSCNHFFTHARIWTQSDARACKTRVKISFYPLEHTSAAVC